MSESTVLRQETEYRKIPGETGIWVFALGDLTMFAAFFACFVWDRGNDVETFNRSRDELHLSFGAFNTCLLLVDPEDRRADERCREELPSPVERPAPASGVLKADGPPDQPEIGRARAVRTIEPRLSR